MGNGSKTVILTAIEDDVILISDAVMELKDGEWVTTGMADPYAVERDDIDIAKDHDDQGDLDDLEVARQLHAYVDRRGCKPDAFAISSFGNVGIENQIISHYPNGGANKSRLVEYDFPSRIKSVFGSDCDRFFIENDASAAALGEQVWGAGEGFDDFAYVWAGRGINVGLILGYDILRGRQHPEAGHALARRYRNDDYKLHAPESRLNSGNCVAHDDCFIGLASARSFMERIDQGKQSGANKPSHFEISQMAGYYFSQICMNLVLHTAPRRIVIGGYTIRKEVVRDLVAAVHHHFAEMIGPYPSYQEMRPVEDFIVPAKLGQQASLLGLMEMTRRRLTIESRSGNK